MAKYQQKLASQGKGKIATTIGKLGIFTPAEDYHQKFYLRKHEALIEALNCTDKELMDSHVATRLNGFVSGKGTLEQLTAEIDSYGLSEEMKNYVITVVKNRKGRGFFCAG